MPVKLTFRERDLIRGSTFPDPDFAKDGFPVKVENRVIVLYLTDRQRYGKIGS